MLLKTLFAQKNYIAIIRYLFIRGQPRSVVISGKHKMYNLKSFSFYLLTGHYFTPLSANLMHARHDADVARSRCFRASHRQINQNQYFSICLNILKEERICYKMVDYTLYLD